MGLRQTISQWVGGIKDALDFGPEFPAAMSDRRVQFAEELTQLRNLLEETRKAHEEKDELIAKLQALGAVRGNMIVDGPVYYVKSQNILDGPYCTSCFQHHHEIVRIVPASRPKGADGPAREWVECGKCRTPFRSERIAEFVNPAKTAATETSAAPQGEGETKSAKAARKPRAQARRPKEQPPEQPRPPRRRKAAP